ncbi:iron-containing alcohol dehydrogenase [Curtobacterium sp. RIT-PI-V]|uniref:iron-containing alcohol dehydrogenase n=1 Tax=Curtobacterium sp. RIT-PI-V TaxID=3035296 RepID=UPI0021D7A33D|nr:iron-containing alcohol dehydrogenase [Curtobacterium sp. RIT-PI-V]
MPTSADGFGWVVHPGPLTVDALDAFVRRVSEWTGAGRVCLVADRNHASVPTIAELVDTLVERLGAQLHLASDDSEELVRSIADAGPWDVVIGIGGGVTLDVAKLVGLDADAMRRVTSPGRSSRVVLPDGPRSTRVALVPTTFGTGSELSSSACVTSRERKRLVSGAALGADLVLARSDLLASLDDEQMTEGLVEVVLRLTTLYAAGEAASFADVVTRASLRQLMEVAPRLRAGGRVPADLRAIASISAFSHTGWLARDRPPMVTLPWIVTTEASIAWSCTKAVAASLVLPGYWSVMRDGDGRLGSYRRLCELWAEAMPGAASPAEALDEIIDGRLRRPSTDELTRLGDDAFAARVTERWGAGLPFMGEAGRDDVRKVIDAALARGRSVALTV